MPAAARSKLCSSVSAWLGIFACIAMSSCVIGIVGVVNCFCGVPSNKEVNTPELISQRIRMRVRIILLRC